VGRRSIEQSCSSSSSNVRIFEGAPAIFRVPKLHNLDMKFAVEQLSPIIIMKTSGPRRVPFISFQITAAELPPSLSSSTDKQKTFRGRRRRITVFTPKKEIDNAPTHLRYTSISVIRDKIDTGMMIN
jgi:hypothetical protein